jgi:hypothetical protein
MSFVSDKTGGGSFFDPAGFAGGPGAKASIEAAETQAASAREAIIEQREAAERAQLFFEPFAGAAERGVEAAGFLADPQAQAQFLQDNPLFDLALENANRQTQQAAASRGRLSAGDTLQQLSDNVLLSAQPLIDRQRQDVGALLNLGTGIATSQANIETGKAAQVGGLLTDIGAAQAAGGVGAAQARAQGTQNILAAAGTAAKIFFSDERLKTNRKLIKEVNGMGWWSWDWNDLAKLLFGLVGSDEGHMAQEVAKVRPDAIVMHGEFYKVNYGVL